MDKRTPDDLLHMLDIIAKMPPALQREYFNLKSDYEDSFEGLYMIIATYTAQQIFYIMNNYTAEKKQYQREKVKKLAEEIGIKDLQDFVKELQEEKEEEEDAEDYASGLTDRLLKCKISQSTIDRINENEALSFTLWCNVDDCQQIIEYLQSIGIIDIDDLLIYKTDLFTETKEEIEALFNKKGSNEELVKLINDDFTNIDILFE